MGLAFRSCVFWVLPILSVACGGEKDSPMEPPSVLIEDLVFTDAALKSCVARHTEYAQPRVEWTHQVTRLECGYEYEVQSLEDISAFPKLEKLLIRNLTTPEVDVALLKNLKYLSLEGSVETVKASDHALLEDLYINPGRPQAVVEVTNLPALKNLSVYFGSEPGTLSINAIPRIAYLSLTNVENLALDPHEFSSLREFQADSIDTDSLDLSLLPQLENMDLRNWTSPELNLTGNISLKKFRCTSCTTGAIMLAENNQLESITLSGTSINHLIVPSATNLTELTVQRNDALASIELPPELPKLKVAQLDGNQLQELPTALWPELEQLSVQSNQLPSLNLASMPKLLELHASRNEIVAVDLSPAPDLRVLGLEGNRIDAIDLSSVKKLQRLNLSENKLTDVDLSENDSLVWLALSENALTEVDAEKLATLERLDVSGNKLTQLDVRTLVNLRELNAAKNQLDVIEISTLEKLERLNLSENRLVSLTANPEAPFSYLDVSNNLLQTLELSSFPLGLSFELKAQNNQLREFSFPKKNDGTVFFYEVDLSHNQLQSLQIGLGTFIQDAIFNANPLTSLDVDSTIGWTYVLSMDISQTLLDCEQIRQLPTVAEVQCGESSDTDKIKSRGWSK